MGHSASKEEKSTAPPPAIRLPAQREGESEILRSGKSRALVERHWDDVSTLYENFQRGVKLYPAAKCLGWREGEGGAGNGGFFRWLTYSEVNDQLHSLASGLLSIGLEPGSFVALYSANCPQWVIAEQACNSISLVTVPLYDTLGHDSCKYIIRQAEITTIFCSKLKTEELFELVQECPSLKTIIQFEPLENEKERAENLGGVTIYSLEEMQSMGKNIPREPIPPTPDSLATICYTSGTTGDPKGVMLSHGNIVADSAGVFAHGISFSSDDIHLSYLPLAHMFERTVEASLWGWGVAVGFYRGDIKYLMDDVMELRPTVFPSVPRLYNRIYDKVMSSVNEAGGMKKKMFDHAYRAKKANLAKGRLTHSLWDPLVFNKIQQKLGGRVEIMLTGSAPISPDVLEFLRIAFAVPVLEGYGQTEGCAASALQHIDDVTVGTVGPPLPCNEVKLVDEPDMGYLSTDKPFPRGEICFRGANIFLGYYKMEEKTKETLDEEGWLHTGDIGEIDGNGNIRIIDRKKNLFKLAQGEYISPEKIEQAHSKIGLIGQCFVYGDSLESNLVAIIVPDEDAAKKWARSHNVREDLDSVVENKEFKNEIFTEMKAVEKKERFRGFERIYDIHLTASPFTLENDLLTPTFKVKRNKVQRAYQQQIDAMYQRAKEAKQES